MNKQLQEAQDLERLFNLVRGNNICIVLLQEIAKANMEKLGCGKQLKPFYLCGWNGFDNKIRLCPDCQKAKEIYERILNNE